LHNAPFRHRNRRETTQEFFMRSISILGLAAATACAALVASSAAQAGGARHAPHGAYAGGIHMNYMHAPMRAPVAFARPAYGGGYGHAHHGWRHRGYGLAGAAVGYAAANSYEGGYGYAAPAASYGYAQPSYGYAAQPATQTWQRTYNVPETVMRPVTRTHLVPVTTYREVQSTQYVPTTVYRQVTKTCSCTINGVTQQVPCADGYAGASYGAAPVYNRPGLFTQQW
jgi:hypothetical protein